MVRLLDLDLDLVGAIACVCFTDLIGECSSLTSKFVCGRSIVGRNADSANHFE